MVKSRNTHANSKIRDEGLDCVSNVNDNHSVGLATDNRKRSGSSIETKPNKSKRRKQSANTDEKAPESEDERQHVAQFEEEGTTVRMSVTDLENEQFPSDNEDGSSSDEEEDDEKHEASEEGEITEEDQDDQTPNEQEDEPQVILHVNNDK